MKQEHMLFQSEKKSFLIILKIFMFCTKFVISDHCAPPPCVIWWHWHCWLDCLFCAFGIYMRKSIDEIDTSKVSTVINQNLVSILLVFVILQQPRNRNQIEELSIHFSMELHSSSNPLLASTSNRTCLNNHLLHSSCSVKEKEETNIQNRKLNILFQTKSEYEY